MCSARAQQKLLPGKPGGGGAGGVGIRTKALRGSGWFGELLPAEHSVGTQGWATCNSSSTTPFSHTHPKHPRSAWHTVGAPYLAGKWNGSELSPLTPCHAKWGPGTSHTCAARGIVGSVASRVPHPTNPQDRHLQF